MINIDNGNKTNMGALTFEEVNEFRYLESVLSTKNG